MADDYRRGRLDPPRNNAEDLRYPPPEGEDRRRLPPVGPDGAALPPISSYPPSGPSYQADPRYPDRSYTADPRYQSDPRSWQPDPPASNGYPPPPDARYPPQTDARYPPQPDARYPPPIPPQHPRQFDDRRPYEDRRQYDDRRQYEDRRQYDDQRIYDDQRQYGDRRPYPDPYYDAQQQPPARAGGYGPDYYRYPPPGPYSYGMPPPPPPPPPPPSQQQSAPRQRTSIACRYCRKRKIRCSGYAHTTNGKCANCDKLRIDCIFQPVSSNSSAAFVPVSAVPGGVPPGTPLYGAYGQPLPPSAASAPQARAYPYPPSDHNNTPPMHSPTGSYPPYDDRDPGRRRTRPPEEEHSPRPPPPNFPADEDPRRRSPVSINSNDTPPTGYHTSYHQSSYDADQAPAAGQNSPGRSMPPQPPLRAPQERPSQTPPQPQSQLAPQPKGQPNPMSLDNLIGPGPRGAVNDIDRNMLGRLNRRS